MVDDRTARAIRQAARLIAEADALLITAGAGMGVDSGLPDFRGRDGFWRGYPALEKRGLTFKQMAQPQWFIDDPQTAWAFYGHRQHLYRETKPHMGFHMLLDWGRAMRGGYFVVTSNVDGQFEKAEFSAERVVPIHGSLFEYQCVVPCRKETWRDEGPALDIDLESMRACGELPRCPFCGGLARPNLLMFDDGAWVAKYRDSRRGHYLHWLAGLKGRRLVVVELGAGTAIPTIRRLGEDLVARGRATLVRINPQASDSDEPAIPIRMGALEALSRIEDKLPEAFKAAARGGNLVRPKHRPAADAEFAAPSTDKGAPRGPERLPPIVATREMEVIDFVGAPDARQAKPAWSREIPTYSDLVRTTFIDLNTGDVEPFNYRGIRVEDEQACLDCWRGPAPDRYAPLPEIGGHLASGYLMTGRTVKLDDAESGIRRGAAIMLLCSAEREVIMTFGVARWPLDAAALWRWLYEGGPVTLKALEFPRVPWVARRLDAAAAEHAAMLPALKEVGRVMTWTWLRYHMYYDHKGGEGSEGG